MQQQIPQLQIAHIPGAGHSIRREQFDGYIAAVRSFLDTWAATYRHADARPEGCNGGATFDNTQMVADCRLLSDLPAQLRGRQWRRHRRLPGHDREAGLSARPWRGCRLALAALSVAAGRLRLRHHRLHRRRARVWNSGRLHRISRRGARARHSRHPRPCAQSHLRSASLVPSSRAQAATIPSATGISGATARMAAHPTTGSRSLADRRGSWTRRRASTIITSILKEQPDLNWRNPEVKQAIWDVARFWLDLGVDGFRLDAVFTIFEHPDLPDHTATPSLADPLACSLRWLAPTRTCQRRWREHG